MNCYNCGKEINGIITREHIPARALFEGFDRQYKNNIITVPACFECNNSYSSTDEEFRNMIGVIAKREANEQLTKKSVKSVLRKKDGYKRLVYESIERIDGVRFDEAHIENFHKKNFKGIFYHQYGKPLPYDFILFVSIDENDCSSATKGIISYLKGFFEWKFSGHKDIFQYCMQPVRENIQQRDKEDKSDLELLDSDTLIACAMIYNQEHAALVYGIKRDYWDIIVNEHSSKGV